MIKKCAVVIGVDKAGNLPVLSAAAKGATEFAQWAKSQQFDTVLITDETEPVEISHIKKAVSKFINADIYTHILIYFAGHGILKAPNDEHWLLSDCPDDPNAAVNVTASRYLASNTGIPYVTFVSDACRSVPGNTTLSAVSGGFIFPNMKSHGPMPEIDMFYASRPGDPAYEALDRTAEAKQYKAIFTNCMLDGLHGNVDEVKRLAPEISNNDAFVFPYELKKYLEKEVPLAAEAVKITLTQKPSIEVASHPPSYLSKFPLINQTPPDNPIKNLAKKDRRKEEEHKRQLDEIDIAEMIEYISADNIKKISAANGFHLRDIKNDMVIDTGFVVPRHFKFETIPHSSNNRIVHKGEDIFIEIDKNLKSIILVGTEGMGTVLGVLPGFMGYISIENDRIVDVNYIPTRTNDRYDEFMIENIGVQMRRGIAAAHVRNGTFMIEGRKSSIIRTASYLRNHKAFDPTLGLYAAYAYAQAGKRKEIKSIYDFMLKEPEPVLYDVMMLASLESQFAVSLARTVPFCPMLTQGWAYLAINSELNNGLLRELRTTLLPGLWTTFNKDGVKIILNNKF